MKTWQGYYGRLGLYAQADEATEQVRGEPDVNIQLKAAWYSNV